MAEISSNFRPEDFQHLLGTEETTAPPPVNNFGNDRPLLSPDMETPVAETVEDDTSYPSLEVTRVHIPDELPQSPSQEVEEDSATILSKALQGMSEQEVARVLAALADGTKGSTETEEVIDSDVDEEEVTEAAVVRPRRGWRKILATLGIGTSLSAEEKEENLWVDVIRKPLHFPSVIGVTSFKGGCGKTTSSIMMSLAIAQARPQSRVIVVDLDPSGNLVTRAKGKQGADVQGYVAAVKGGSTDPYGFVIDHLPNLDIMGSRLHATTPELSAKEVVMVVESLMRHYDVVVLDMPQRTDAHAYTAMLAMLDVVVFLFEAKEDALATVADTRVILDNPATAHLIDRRVVAFNHARPQSSNGHFNPGEVVDHLLNVERAEVVELGYSENLFWPGPIDEPVIGHTDYPRFVQLAAASINMIGDAPPVTRPSILNK